ncbi:MAG: class I SAM-dependent methyltransferase [Dehalococcoidia bacterium]|nr:class I SAM-dependent methyltransferase [Dehalococcoidia bacterium]
MTDKARARSPRRRLAELCFDLVYNPIYDATTARLSPYQRFQDGCVGKLRLSEGDRVLCLGTGTGNEIVRIMEGNAAVSVVGVDISRKALQRARAKARRLGKPVELHRMDAQQLGFPDRSFDAVVCLHVMGFLREDKMATSEIFRVLKDSGQFVVTFPSGNGLLKLGAEAGQGVLRKVRAGRWGQAIRDLAALTVGGLVNIPVSWWVKPRGGFYSRRQLDEMFSSLRLGRWQVEEDDVYQEFIVWGAK